MNNWQKRIRYRKSITSSFSSPLPILGVRIWSGLLRFALRPSGRWGPAFVHLGFLLFASPTGKKLWSVGELCTLPSTRPFVWARASGTHSRGSVDLGFVIVPTVPKGDERGDEERLPLLTVRFSSFSFGSEFSLNSLRGEHPFDATEK